MLLPGCCLRALTPVIWIGVMAVTTPSDGAPLFTCESGGGSAVAQAGVDYVDPFGAVFELDFVGKVSPVVHCEGGSVSASAVARFLGWTGTGQSTYSLAVNADGIAMRGS